MGVNGSNEDEVILPRPPKRDVKRTVRFYFYKDVWGNDEQVDKTAQRLGRALQLATHDDDLKLEWGIVGGKPASLRGIVDPSGPTG